ncbi:MAG: PhoU family transcriptional regulator, partial [Thermoprotei archaeon ex4572_64]
MSYEVETRKVQLTGGATLIISLPKDWARHVGLKPGDEVLIVPQHDNSLLIIPKKIAKHQIPEITIHINDEFKDARHIERILLSYYLAGYDVLRVGFTDTTINFKRHVKEVTRKKLAGTEVIEEDRNVLTIQNLIDVLNMSMDEILNKIVRTVMNMFEDLKIIITKFDENIAQDLIDRDNEVDKLYRLLNRQLRKILLTGRAVGSKTPDPRAVLEYQIISKALERIADNVSDVVHEIANKMGKEAIDKVPCELKDKIINIINDITSLFNTISSALSNKAKLVEINHVLDNIKNGISRKIEEILDQLYRYELDSITIASLRVILYRILRVAEW